MEPICVSFEVEEPTPGRSPCRRFLEGGFLQPLAGTWTSSQDTFRFGSFHSSQSSGKEGKCFFQRHLPPRESDFLLSQKNGHATPTSFSNMLGKCTPKPWNSSCPARRRFLQVLRAEARLWTPGVQTACAWYLSAHKRKQLRAHTRTAQQCLQPGGI